MGWVKDKGKDAVQKFDKGGFVKDEKDSPTRNKPKERQKKPHPAEVAKKKEVKGKKARDMADTYGWKK